MSKDESQLDKFKEAARELETDDDPCRRSSSQYDG